MNDEQRTIDPLAERDYFPPAAAPAPAPGADNQQLPRLLQEPAHLGDQQAEIDAERVKALVGMVGDLLATLRTAQDRCRGDAITVIAVSLARQQVARELSRMGILLRK